jgi:hypothetical protein
MEPQSQEQAMPLAEQISQSMEQDYRRYPHNFEEAEN